METSKEQPQIVHLEDMKIKIQTFDNNFPLSINRKATVTNLKDKITEVESFINLVDNDSRQQAASYLPRKATSTE